MAGAVLEPPRNDPPASPAVGDCYIVGSSPTGAWVGWTDAIAGFSAGGWRRIAAVPGMVVHVQSIDEAARYAEAGWELGVIRGSRLILDGQQVVGPRAAAITAPTGGSTIDAESRGSIAAILSTLREHGLISS